MKKKLPEHAQNVTSTAIVVAARKELPSIFRIITEHAAGRRIHYAKLMAATLVSTLLLIGIVLECMALYNNLKEVQNLKLQRVQMMGEINYLQNIAGQYTDYRDIYFRLAELEYNLGNVNASSMYVKKTIEIDPNFMAGRVLAAHIKAAN